MPFIQPRLRTFNTHKDSHFIRRISYLNWSDAARIFHFNFNGMNILADEMNVNKTTMKWIHLMQPVELIIIMCISVFIDKQPTRINYINNTVAVFMFLFLLLLLLLPQCAANVTLYFIYFYFPKFNLKSWAIETYAMHAI